ncbi:SixA phosphatase family protein [Parvicella tangerina]|uniref:Histidine phosphatase family protein n=1 Tax=Parvicella tangerina TaxID=2829795 RepID=A0A916JSE7_9FLAO|nr:histidine phosphatase family protein [Parvicella tangerina]CAG5086931.1 hypothetical protein CRYO30217_03336 [Parvicella tangerina]
MKKLFIIRHGKSDWNQGVKDFDRPLNPRGKDDAPKMGKYLLQNYETPDRVLSSSANRAISTARLLLNAMNFDLAKIDKVDELYHAPTSQLLLHLSELPNSCQTAFIFGHNPGLSDLTTYLTSEPIELKTCCVAVLELQVEEWSELSRETCTLERYLSPKTI